MRILREFAVEILNINLDIHATYQIHSSIPFPMMRKRYGNRIGKYPPTQLRHAHKRYSVEGNIRGHASRIPSTEENLSTVSVIVLMALARTFSIQCRLALHSVRCRRSLGPPYFLHTSNNKEASFPALKDFNCIDNEVHCRFYVYAKLFSVENVASAVIIP